MGKSQSKLNQISDLETSQDGKFKPISPPSVMTKINAKYISESYLDSTDCDTSVSNNGYTCTPYCSLRTPQSPWNGRKLTRRLLSDRIIDLVSDFWHNTIDSLSMEERLEIGCSIFNFTNKATENIFAKYRKSSHQFIESHSLKFLDMIGYIVRLAETDSKNTDSLLRLGQLHESIGITIECYAALLKQTHDTFLFYFPDKYTTEVMFSFDELFTYVTEAMTGADLKILSPLENASFLHSLRQCIKSDIGRQLLFKWLHNSYCDEMVIFVELMLNYKAETDDRIKFLIAKDIDRICIDFDAVFAINISYDARKQMKSNIQYYEKRYNNIDEEFVMDKDFFIDIEDQICRLISQTHWRKFKETILESFIGN